MPRALVEKKLRDNSWYLHWYENGRRERRSLGRMTDDAAEFERKKAEASLLNEQSIRLSFERQGHLKIIKSRVVSERYNEVAVYLPSLLKETKKRAVQRHIDWGLSVDDLKLLLEESGGFCTLSGIPFSLERRLDAHKRPFAPSIDRMSPSSGYVLRNCRLVCVAVNNAMGEWGIEVLQQITIGMGNFMPPDRVVR